MKNREHLFSLTKKDFVVETYRGSGKGGQNRNKRDTAVRIKHPASGAVAECQEQRTQGQNKRIAFRRLAKTLKFKLWLNERINDTEKKMEEAMKTVEQSLNDQKNIKTEVFIDGKWDVR